MDPHQFGYAHLMFCNQNNAKIPDPGTTKTISIQKSFGVCGLTIAAVGETRSLPVPTVGTNGLGVGTRIIVVADEITNSGTCVVNGVVFATEGQWEEFQVVQYNSTRAWVSRNTSTGLSISSVAITNHVASTSTAGRNVYIETQDGGDGAAGSAAGNYTLTAGFGGSALGGDQNGGDSGSISLVTQIGGTQDGAGTAGKSGLIFLNAAPGAGGVFKKQAAPTAETGTSQTYAVAEMLGGLITSTQSSAVAGTLETGANMDAGVQTSVVGTNAGFEWSLINLGSASGAVTMTASTGHTYVGNATVAISTSARFFTRRTAASTWITYRIS